VSTQKRFVAEPVKVSKSEEAVVLEQKQSCFNQKALLLLM
jgi:hypothetical protein